MRNAANFQEDNFTGIQDCWRTILNEGVQGLQRSCSGNCGSGFIVRVQEILTKTLPGKTSAKTSGQASCRLSTKDQCCEGRLRILLTGSGFK